MFATVIKEITCNYTRTRTIPAIVTILLRSAQWLKLGLWVQVMLLIGSPLIQAQTTLGGVNLGNLPNYLLFYSDANIDANWQGATKGFIGNVAVDGIQASERTSGGVPYAGTIYTNDVTLDAWADIVDQNDPAQVTPAQAF